MHSFKFEASRSGASAVIANDIDINAATALKLNADINNIEDIQFRWSDCSSANV